MTLAHLLAEGMMSRLLWFHHGDPTDLALARLLLALPVAVLTKDPRLGAMANLARKILADHEGLRVSEPHVEPQGRWMECEQPYRAWYGFEFHKSLFASASRRGALEAWRENVAWAVTKAEEEREREPEDVARCVSWTILTSLICGPEVKGLPHLRDRPISLQSRASAGTDDAVVALGDLTDALTQVFYTTERSRWGSQETAERCVRAVLRGLGMPADKTRALFDAERKEAKRSNGKRPPSKRPSRGQK